MPNPITIDNYTIEIHERYATDQKQLDLKYVKDANLIPPHLEIPGSSSYISKWEELFEVRVNSHPWAFFAPPPDYALMRNRFFSYVISPQFDWLDHEEEEEEQKKEEKRQIEEFKKKIQAKKSKKIPMALFERDRSALLNLMDSIQMLNGFLREIHGRKLQYQKG